MDNIIKQGFLFYLPHTFWSIAHNALTMSVDKFLFIHENRVQSLSLLYYAPPPLAYISWSFFSWRENEMFTWLWTMTYPRRESALDILKWICNHRVGKAGGSWNLWNHTVQQLPPLQAFLPGLLWDSWACCSISKFYLPLSSLSKVILEVPTNIYFIAKEFRSLFVRLFW